MSRGFFDYCYNAINYKVKKWNAQNYEKGFEGPWGRGFKGTIDKKIKDVFFNIFYLLFFNNLFSLEPRKLFRTRQEKHLPYLYMLLGDMHLVAYRL